MTPTAFDNICRQVAWKKIIGYTDAKIRKSLNLTTSQLARVQSQERYDMYLEALNQDLQTAWEQRYQRLLGKAVDRASKIIDYGSEEGALQLIELVMKMHGKYVDKLPPGGFEALMESGGGFIAGAAAMTGEQASNVMDILSKTRNVTPPKE